MVGDPAILLIFDLILEYFLLGQRANGCCCRIIQHVYVAFELVV
jgi:hypothetical protein